MAEWMYVDFIQLGNPAQAVKQQHFTFYVNFREDTHKKNVGGKTPCTTKL